MNTLLDFVEHVLKPMWTVIVMVAFLGIVAYAYWPRSKSRFESYGAIPLEEDDQDSSPAKPAKER